MVALVSAGIVAATVGLLLFHVRQTFYAKPINYHTDVLRQR